jgi:hypothetical protein
MTDQNPGPFASWSDKELAAWADQGLHGQGAIVESLRRHRDALIAEQQASDRLSKVQQDAAHKLSRKMAWVTAAGVFLAVVQIFVAVWLASLDFQIVVTPPAPKL